MKVTLNLENQTCQVTKEKTDKKFTSSNWSDAESTFLYHVLQELKKQGYDLIKKRMHKDGHLVDDLQQYIRSRKLDRANGYFCIFNNGYALFDAGKSFNTTMVGESVYLMVEKLS